MEEVLRAWGLDQGEMHRIHPSAWEVEGRYVLKEYLNPEELEQNVRVLEALRRLQIPAARVVRTISGKSLVQYGGNCYLLTRKLPGKPLSDIWQNRTLARKMGETIGILQLAFRHCEDELKLQENSLLDETKGWVREELARTGWSLVEELEFVHAQTSLEMYYAQLPCQLIHRDVHFGNFLFDGDELSGYLDFDLTQRNIRIFDPCYFLLGLLAKEKNPTARKKDWLELQDCTFSGYDNKISMNLAECRTIPYVMECIELLFAAYFSRISNWDSARGAAEVFRFIRSIERELVRP